MRILVILLTALVLAVGAGAAFFYINIFQPMEEKMKMSMPEFDRLKLTVAKYKEKEKNESAWISPLASSFSRELTDEIKAGSAEVLSFDHAVVINIAEPLLFMDESRTFAKESPRILQKIDALLRHELIKGKDILIGNSTRPVPPQTDRRKKIPGKDARTLSAERSIELIKYFERKGMQTEELVAASYGQNPALLPGSKIKERKTIIIISTPPKSAGAMPVTSPTAAALSSATATALTSTPSLTGSPQPKTGISSSASGTLSASPGRPARP